MQQKLRGVNYAKREHVPDVRFDQMRLEYRDYVSYSSWLQKNIGSSQRQLAAQHISIFTPSLVFGNDVMHMRYTARCIQWLPMSAHFRIAKKSTYDVFRQVTTRGAECTGQRHC